MTSVHTGDLGPILAGLFAELVRGAEDGRANYTLNTGDIGLRRSLDQLTAQDASRSSNDGATIAAHVQHLNYGLSLMNRWASEGGNPFADATWDEAWKTSTVDAAQWEAIRREVGEQTDRWLAALASPQSVTDAELSGMISSIAHLGYHLGAIRQIDRQSRGPREGTFGAAGAPLTPGA